jgi:Hypervirulence associated proteins TUDOR domain
MELTLRHGRFWHTPASGPGYASSMAKDLKKGDKVEWNSHGSKAKGEVKKKITSETEEAGRKVKASKDEPQYLVESEKSGGTAVHKPGALKKKS